MNRFDTHTMLLTVALVGTLTVTSVLLLTIPALEWLLPWYPFASALMTALFAYFLFRLLRTRRRYLEHDVQVLAELLASGNLTELPRHLTDSGSPLAPFVSTAREIRHQMLRSLSEAETTAHIIGGSVNRASRMLDQFSVLLQTLETLGNQIVAARKDLEHTVETETEQSGLAEQIIRIRLELENFEQIPKEMVDLLKHTYAEHHQEQHTILDTSERFVTDLDGLLTQLESALDQFAGQISHYRETAENIHNSIGTLNEELTGRLAQARLHTEKQQELHAQLAENTTTLPNIPERMQVIRDAVTELDTITGKQRILVLNAAIFAADAGDSGQGFKAITRDMKNLNQETERTHSRLRTQIGELEQQLTMILEELPHLVKKQGRLDSRDMLGPTEAVVTDLLNPLISSSSEFCDSIHQQGDTCEQLTHHMNRARSALTQGQAHLRKRKDDADSLAERKYRIDRMVIETDRFSERIGSEVPDMLRQFGTILEQVASLQNRFIHVHEILMQFIQSGIPEEVGQLQALLETPDIQLLRDVPRLLDKTHRTLKTIESS